jgi:hypothetical protein
MVQRRSIPFLMAFAIWAKEAGATSNALYLVLLKKSGFPNLS